MRKYIKQVLSFILIFTLLITCFSNEMIYSSAQTVESTNNQIIFSGEEKTVENGNVKVNKTIESTDTENVFNITLDVETSEDLTKVTTSPDAATVLVLDVSGSMAWDAEGHKKDFYPNPSRFESMQKAAINFLDGYSNVETNADGTKPNRWITIITFSSNAERKINWIDVSTPDGLAKAKQTINSLKKPEGGTNIEGALQLAYNNLNGFKDATNKDLPNNKNVILLTDGEPTYHIGRNDKTSLTWIKGEEGGRSEAETSDWKPVGGTITDGHNTYSANSNNISSQIKDVANLYTVAFATSSSAKFHVDNKNKPLNYDPHTWMSTFATRALKAGNESELLTQFDKINQIIKLSAQAWKVTDPMGENILYQDVESNSKDNNAYSFANDTLTWDVKNSTPKTKVVDNKTIYQYSLTYQVVLDTSIPNVDYSKVNTNQTTTLQYLLSEEINNSETIEMKTVNFNIPQVKGLFGSLNFTKVNEKEEPLNNVNFTLSGTTTGSNKSVTLTAISDQQGKVSFNNIPAGIYILSETVPEGYQNPGTWQVNVSYGQVTVLQNNQETTLNSIKNLPLEKQLTITKAWSGLTDEQLTDIPEQVTIKIYQDLNLYRQITLTKQENYTKIISVPYSDGSHEYTYSIAEKEINGYTSNIEETPNHFNVNNHYNEGTLTISGIKTWIVPEETTDYPDITIVLKQKIEGQDDSQFKEIASTSLINGATNYQFEGLHEYAPNGLKYIYAIEEKDVNGYVSAINNFDITNTYTPGQTSVTVEKVWEGIQEGDALPTITVQLYQNGNPKDSIQLSSQTGWQYTFTNLEKYNTDGTEFNYTVEEIFDGNEGYHSSINGTVITNTFNNAVTNVSIEKVWENIPDNTTVPTITVDLLRDGIKIDTVQLMNGTTNYTFENLPVYATIDGHQYIYTVEEQAVNGYVSSITSPDNYQYTITNTYTGGDKISITGNKTWKNIDENEVVPNITIRLYQDEKEIDMTTLENGALTYQFTDLPTYAYDGHAYVYDVQEDTVKNYQSEKDGYNFINTKINQELPVEPSKEEPTAPQTGDTLSITTLIYTSSSLMALAGIYLLKKRYVK